MFTYLHAFLLGVAVGIAATLLYSLLRARLVAWLAAQTQDIPPQDIPIQGERTGRESASSRSGPVIRLADGSVL